MKHYLQAFLPVGLVTALAALLLSPRCFAQWTSDNSKNTPVCILDMVNPLSPAAVSDGMGGAIITWARAGHVYAQRLDAVGVARWALNGIPICLTPGLQSAPVIVSDGAGGAIIGWVNMTLEGGDTLLYSVMAQRVDASGMPQWGANGDTVISIPRRTGPPYLGGGEPQRGGVRRLAMVGDGAGGAIALCYAVSGSTPIVCIINRIDVAGGLPWGAGTDLLAAYNGIGGADIVSDCAGGAIFWWTYERIEQTFYAIDRIDAYGARRWGDVLITHGNFQTSAAMSSDGAGGAIIVWEGSGQRIVAGSARWGDQGLALTYARGLMAGVPGPNGGAIFAGTDSGPWSVDSAGNVTVYLGEIPPGTTKPGIVSDGSGGAYVGVNFRGTEAGRCNKDDNWSFRTSSSVSAQCTPAIVNAGGGSAIIVFADLQRGIKSGVYAQIASRAGLRRGSVQSISSITDIPGDQGGKVRVQWTRHPADDAGTTDLPIVSYGVWRKIPPGTALGKTGSVVSPLNDTLGVSYDFVGSVPAVQSPGYNLVCPTLDDSSATGVHGFTFLVTAHTSDPAIFHISAADSGYSVDNLAPAPPANPLVSPLAGGPIRVQWDRNRTDPDVGSYVVYRSIQDGFLPGDGTRLRVVLDTSVVDSATAGGQTYYYRITTVDVHGNQSVPTAQLMAVATGIGRDVAPTEFSLSQNYPNPFNPGTTIRYGLPSRSLVKLAVFNTLGQEVAVLFQGDQEGGSHEVSFDASDLSSGVYFYRLQAGTFVQSRKLLVLR